MKKVQQGANLTVQMGTSNFVVPDGFILEPQGNLRPKNAPNSNPNPGSVLNPAPSPVLAPVMVPSPSPAVAQPTGHTGADEKPDPATSHHQVGSGGSGVEGETAPNSPGYHTADYAWVQANKLALRGASYLSVEMLLADLKKLANYLYIFACIRLLRCRAPILTWLRCGGTSRMELTP